MAYDTTDADEILNDLSYDEDYAPTDDAKDTIMGAVSAAFEDELGDENRFVHDLYNSPELCAAPPLRGAVLRMPF